MTSHLFVYGTLMSMAKTPLGRDMRLRLRREARVVGPATVQGQLYDLGRYPVLVLSIGSTDRVHGELIEIADPVATFPWLDAYEGIGRNAGTADEYQRVEAFVDLASGGQLPSWIYLYQKPITGLPRIRSGRWTG